MHGDDLVRAQDHFGMLAAFFVPAGHLLDQGYVIGAQIGEDVVHAEIDQTFKEMMRGRVAAHALLPGAFSPTNRLRKLPIPVISISTTSPALWSGEAASGPTQITAPGHRLKQFIS